MIIGLTGTNCAGKDTVAEYLMKEKGFRHFSLSDVLRMELKKRGKQPTRDNLIEIGKGLRTRYGNSILARRAVKFCGKFKNCVLTSIRHPAEITELRKNKGFRLINVDAPAKVRFARMIQRKRAGDPATFREFLNYEKAEMQTRGAGQQIGKCREMADVTLRNSGKELSKLYARIDRIIL